jgi:hypothetical protein
MISILLGNHPETGELWKYHTKDGEMWPFSKEEMEVDRAEYRREYNALAVKIFLSDAAEIDRELTAEERIRIANETGIIKFSSGRTMDPASGIVGLSHKFEVGEGLDNLPNIVADWNADQAGEDYYAEWLRPEDLSELADIMIDRWQRFKASLGEKA